MVKTIEKAIAEMATLPAESQEEIGRQLLAHVAKVKALRADLASGLRSLDEGKGRQVDVEALIARSNAGHGRR